MQPDPVKKGRCVWIEIPQGIENTTAKFICFIKTIYINMSDHVPLTQMQSPGYFDQIN